ncbi:MBOAT family protein [Nannocystis sp. SCPEA4]|uniref:MBOAT family O-acyltransferase n=1 Tax=Nannocystis sp. SCPEA4 TaxID=2996787 RepID=UPI00227216CE|nr:MBOAT family protein [Nannocystis sp. SCPEA4]MCY1061519.1 MBOAT family protein [Nannocystis sp. SCPEA4]
MAFNSLEYALLLAATAILFFGLGYRGRLLVLVAASVVFYGAFSVPLLGLIFLSALVDFTAALKIARTEDAPTRRRWLLFSLATNLGLLGYFKYANFFLDSAGTLLGRDFADLRLDIVLPAGISFYTFQTMSYTIDVYRRQIQPTASLLRFFLFVSFFPQLIAGPIERAGHLLVQFDHAATRRFRVDNLVSGLQMIGWGMFKKVVIADHCAAISDRVFSAPHAYDGWSALIAAYAFTLQIYCDFSAYSEIARGSARIFGVDLMVNFDRPYLSRNISEFWRRWHISLSEWFRDYVYIPLGGNRGSRGRALANLTITMLLSGLWHGAAWAFVVWGLYHGLLLLVHSLARPHLARLAALPRFGRVMGPLAWFCTLHLVIAGWVLFRAHTLADAGRMFAAIGDLDARALAPAHLGFLALFFGFVGMQALDRRHTLLARIHGDPSLSLVFYAAVILACILLGKEGGGDFIYFQF